MKKVLSAALALMLAAGMTTASFAAAAAVSGNADTDPQVYYDDLVENGVYDDENGYPIATTLIGPFGYDSDDKYLTLDDVQYGKTAYYLLTAVKDANGTPELITDSDSVNGLRVKTDWEEGGSLVENVSVIRRRVDGVGTYDKANDNQFIPDYSLIDGYIAGGDFANDGTGKYYYMIAVSVEDSTSTSDSDIIGTMTLSKSKKPKADDIEFDIEINVDWEQSYRNNATYEDVDGDIDIAAETYYSVKFNGDDEIEIAFADESTFTVDISGQGRVLLYYDTEFNSSVAARYPLAELNFWNGNGARFNRTGEFFLSVGEDADYAQFLYQVNADGSLSEVPGAEYDDSDEGFYFKTRTLGSYVYSDMELELGSGGSAADDSDDASLVVTPVDTASTTPVVPINPGTGARA